MNTPILVTGAEGMLGSAVVRAGVREGLEIVGLSRRDCDITDFNQVHEILGQYRGSIVINCAGIVRGRQDVDAPRMTDVNSLGPYILAQHAGRLLHISTDCVFDGTLTQGAYDEDSQPCPPDAYGTTKLVGEVWYGPHLTVRASFVGLGQRGLLQWLLAHPEGATVPGYTNWLWNGWTAEGLAPLLLAVAQAKELTGLLHLPGPQGLSKCALLHLVKERLRPDLHIEPTEASEPRRMYLTSKLVEFSAVRTSWGVMLGELEDQYRALRCPPGVSS